MTEPEPNPNQCPDCDKPPFKSAHALLTHSYHHRDRLTAMQITARRRRIWDMRVDGKSIRQIADTVEIPEATVRNDMVHIAREMDATRLMASETNIDMQRLEKLFSIYWRTATDEADPNLEHAQFCVKILERKAKMLGMDAPKKVDLRMLIVEWAEREGLDPEDVIDIAAPLLIAAAAS